MDNSKHLTDTDTSLLYKMKHNLYQTNIKASETETKNI